LGVFMQHVEALSLVLLREGNPGSLQCLASAVARPRLRQFLAPSA
jgi:hypothetical protein